MGGGTLGIFGREWSTGILEPLTYTTASSAENLLPYTRPNSPNPPLPKSTVLADLNKFVFVNLFFLYF